MSSVTGPVKILAIHAHPDDIELQCAGTLIRLKQKGCSISLATMTPGDCGSAELAPDEIAEVRRMEAVRSAELIGADYTCLEFRDLSIVHDNESRQRVTEVIRKTRPDIVITAPPVDYMSDHEMTSFIVDVTATFEQKLKMLACHESQRAWLRRQHGLDEYLEGCRRWSAERGKQIGVEYGEAFTQHRGHPYPHDNLLQQLLN